MAAREQASVSAGMGYEAAWALSFGQALRPFRPGQTEWSLRLIDGPNMENLGPTGRDMRTYGTLASVRQLHEIMRAMAEGLGTRLTTFTSDHEAEIIGHIYDTAADTAAYLINPAGVNLTGQPTVQALADAARPVIELHFANVASNGWDFGAVTCAQAAGQIFGLRHYSYISALFGIIAVLDKTAAEGAHV
jgi:3-dehydroquinate dehydratase